MMFKINSTGQVIVADLAFVTAHYPGDFTEVAETAPPVVVDPCEWLIDHMPLLDRFGPAIRHLFLKSQDVDVVALRLDYFARKWLDLRHADLQGGFYFMAGVTVPILGTIATPIAGLTPGMVAEQFATKVLPTENQWLRSQLFPK